MKLSVITPVFNAEKTIERTINSVLSQGQKSQLEYIVIDGGSTDNTLKLIDKYRSHFSHFVSEKDNGVYDAMNKGLLYATGDVIGIINSDDWYNEGAFTAVEAAFSKDPDLDLLYSPVDTYFKGKYLIQFVPGAIERLPFKFTLNHPSCFVKKSVYDKIGGYNLGYSIAADYDFILRAYRTGFKFGCLSSSLASYSLNGLSGRPLAKFQQIYQSWLVGSAYAKAQEPEIQFQRKIFYSSWLLKELLVFPVKHFVDPHLARKLKSILRQVVGGKLPSDEYGAW